MPTKYAKMKLLYEGFIICLSIVTIALLIMEFTMDLTEQQVRNVNIIDTAVLIVFVADYIIRFVLAKGKWKFVKSNVPDLLSIIPFNQVFQTLRVFRIFRISKLIKLTRLGKSMRVLAVFSKFSSRISDFVRTNNFIYVTYIAGASLLFGAIGISYAEKMDFGNALWWSIVTTTTVGYGDISPKTALGKMIAVILMVIGIGFLGMLTGTISTYFLKRHNEPDCIKRDFLSLDGLNEDDIKHVESYVEYLKNRAK